MQPYTRIGTDAFLLNLAKRALNKKARLSFFERQQAIDLGLSKAFDAAGNLDLNEAANLMNQSPSQRISPNVRASQEQAEGWTKAGKAESPDMNKAMNVREGDKARCKRYHKAQGHTSCSYCHGIGFDQAVAQEVNKSMGISPNHARHNVDV